jgi:hypothetical protein
MNEIITMRKLIREFDVLRASYVTRAKTMPNEERRAGYLEAAQDIEEILSRVVIVEPVQNTEVRRARCLSCLEGLECPRDPPCEH